MPASVAAIVLAAGASSRMAPRNKLLLRDAAGLTMVGRVVHACCASRVDEVLVVTGHAAAGVERAVLEVSAGDRVQVVHADDHALGQSSSLRAGLEALADQVGAALICLGDMPLVSSLIIDRIVDLHDVAAGRLIVVPTAGGRRGNPVLWNRGFFPAMAGLSGDAGARGLLQTHAASVIEIEVGDDAVLRDFDTRDAVLAGF